MKNKLILYALFFLFGIHGSHKNLIKNNNMSNTVSSTRTSIRIFLENHLLLVSSLLGLCGIVALFFRHFNKEINNISFDFNNKTPGNALTNEGIGKMINDDDQERTKQAEDQEREERNQKRSESDMGLINKAKKILEEITEKKFLEKEIRENIAKAENSEKTPKHTFIEENNETDLVKYASSDLSRLLDDSKNCIMQKSEALLKTIFGINEEEKRNYFLEQFKAGMDLLQQTKLKKFENINIENLINKVQQEVSKKKRISNYYIVNLDYLR